MAQEQFTPPGNHGDARAIWNGNAVDAEARITALEDAPLVELTNYHTVESLSDFPAPVSSEITLTEGVWWINGSIDMGPNRLVVPGNARLFSAFSQTGVLTWTSGTGPRIQFKAPVGDEVFSIKELTLIDTIPGQDMFATDGTALAVVLQTVQVSGCIGAIDVSRTLFCGQCNFFSICDGFRMGSGTGKNRLILTDCAFNHASSGVNGPLIDLETSEWSRITLNNAFFVTDAASSAIEGLPNNGNLSADGVAEIIGCGFNGDGDALSGGISQDDVQWLFSSNVGQPSSLAFGQVVQSTNATATVANGVYEQWAGTNFTSGDSARWTIATDGTATYDGITAARVIYDVAWLCEMASGGRKSISFDLFHTPLSTGTPVQVGVELTVQVGGSGEDTFAFKGTVQVEQGDKLEMRLRNNDDGIGVIVSASEAFITTVPAGV